VAAGNYSITARATDDRDASVTSASIEVSVNGSPPSPVTLLNPLWSGDSFVFSFVGEAGRGYGVDYVNALGGNWQRLTNITGNGGMTFVTNRNVPLAGRFYRVESQ